MFSWLVEPEAWEQVAFLPAADERLRKAIGVPLSDPAGRRFRCVSPNDLNSGSARTAKWLKSFNRAAVACDRFRRLAASAVFLKKELAKLQQRAGEMEAIARPMVAGICGSENPTLAPPVAGSASRLFPDGRPRTFGAGELLLSWVNDPEAWETVAFLPVANEVIEALGIPAGQTAGTLQGRVSPRQVDSLAEVSKKIDELRLRCGKFRQLTFNPDLPKDRPARLLARWDQVKTEWATVTASPAVSKRISRDARIRDLVVESGQLVQGLLTKLGEGEFSRAKVEPAVVALSRVAEKLRKRLARSDRATAALGAELAEETVELELALYDNEVRLGPRDRGCTLRLVPALNPAALEENRSPEDDASPWLAFQAMIRGSEDVLRGYPLAQLRAVREAFGRLRAAYFDRADADQLARFAAAMSRFAAAVRALGEATDPKRDDLPLLNRDRPVIEATAYPPTARQAEPSGRLQAPTTETSLAAEVFYNRFDAFYWSWIASLVATVSLALAVGKCRRALFWLGLAVLLIAQVVAAVGLGLRMYVIGTVPLTGMFETVVFIAICVALLAVGFTLEPLFARGLQAAWQMTGRSAAAEGPGDSTGPSG